MSTVILQRVVPHYRVPLFERLHREFGWIVATDIARDGRGLNVAQGDPPWLRRFRFRRSRNHEYRALVPTGAILSALRPQAIISEFSPQLSSTWRLSADALLGRGGTRKLVYWSQGPNLERGFRGASALGSQALRLALLAPAHAQIVYTPEGADYLRRRLPGNRPIFVAGNTVDIGAFPGRDIDSSPGNPAEAHLLFVGRLTPDKRVPMLVEAFARARQSLPGIRLTIVGDGPDRAAVERAAQTLGGSVVLAGAVYDERATASLMQSASLFVYAGSIGLAANHALAYGIPILIFDEPGPGAHHHPEHRYVVDGLTGFRVAPPTSEALAGKIVELGRMKVPPRRSMGPRIHAYARDMLSLDNMVRGFRQLNGYLGDGD